ncbi:class II aldolase/adducin family protein [Paenibacillus kobensis]|uniref:class II aldolase/adducin family protein n=1 Tax=Paenibacillus kobensis TaxID=59841 RepID=UPI000FD7AC0D|nr:class II aldolase/adducin family protein [Paenibacillus kobensis]
MTTIEEAKQLVIQAGIRLVETGLIARTWGNVSHRIDGGRFVITPSGRDYRSLTPDDIVIVQTADCSYSGPVKPSSERGVHAAVYKQFPDVNFVIHTHQTYASAISSCGLNAINVERGPLAGEILCAAYALPSTKKLSRSVAAALAATQARAVIMQNHGAICYGADAEEAFLTAQQLESACDHYIKAAYRQLSGSERADAASISRYALRLDRDAVSDEGAHSAVLHDIEKRLPNSRRTEDGYALLDPESGNEVMRIRFDEPEASLPEEARIYRQLYLNHRSIQHTTWNSCPEAVAISQIGAALKPMLDDYAQIVGTSAKAVGNQLGAVNRALKRSSAVFVRDLGALCCGSSEDDANAVSMVVDKNCKAYVAARLLTDAKPIHYLESLLMRFVYLKQYSKQAAKSAH